MTNLNNLKSSTIKYLPCVVSDSRCINHNPGKPPICTVRVSTVDPLSNYHFIEGGPGIEIEKIVEIPHEIYEKIKNHTFLNGNVKLKNSEMIALDLYLDGISPVNTTKKINPFRIIINQSL